MRRRLDHRHGDLLGRRHMAVVVVAAGLMVLGSGCGRSGIEPGAAAEVTLRQSADEASTTTVDGDGKRDSPPSATTPVPTTRAPAMPVPTDPPQAPEPAVVRIPAIGVEAVTVPLGLRSDGSIEVPTDFDQAGWWAGGPEPGESGPAVVLGHVDSRQGPAVFFRLRDLQLGDPIHIDRIDGSVVTYLVDRVEQHPKDAFPTDAVYGQTPDPVLRLVTCGGQFDRNARSYRDNIIVYANVAPVRS